MRKSKKGPDRKRALGFRLAIGALVVTTAFAAGALWAGEKADASVPQRRLLVPDGCTVVSIYYAAAENAYYVQAKDAAGELHLFAYKSARGEQKIILHTTTGKVPAAEAFND